MTRIVNAPNATALATPSVRACVMVDLDFASGHVYANDGTTEIVYGGHTFLPLGQFGGIDAVDEALDTIARPLKLTLSGVDASLAATAQNEVYQNRSALLYLALLDLVTGQLVAAPEVAWEGRMDYMQISIDAGLGKITVNCEHRLKREPRIARYTDEDQQILHPGDTFLNMLKTITGFKCGWLNQSIGYAGPTITYNGPYPKWPQRPGGL